MQDRQKTITLLREADQAYLAGAPLMEDAQYDAIREQAIQAWPDDPYFQQIGATAHLDKVKLGSHMGSQLKVNTEADMIDWFTRVARGQPVIVSHKMDGNSIEVWYRDMRLYRVATRGDGEEGQDITANAMRWPNLPHTLAGNILKGDVFVRGEAMISNAKFAEHFADQSNPRNTCSGIIQRKDGTDNEHVEFIAFGLQAESDMAMVNEQYLTQLLTLRALQFTTVEFNYIKSSAELIDHFKKIDSERRQGLLDYTIDGLIVAIDSLAAQRSLGFSPSGKHPLGQIAWKFKNEGKTTQLRGISLSVGHTGAIVPTGILDPVTVAGVNITSVTLNNFGFIADLGIDVGDEVFIERANDVIPMLTHVTHHSSERPCFPMPKNCPACGGAVELKGRILFCKNSLCSGRNASLIETWIKKVGIEEIGDALLDALTMKPDVHDPALVQTPADLYTLTPGMLSTLRVGEGGRLGESSARKVVASIQKSRVLPISTFMGALGIPLLGRSMAAKIGLQTVDAWLRCTVEELCQMPGIGETKATAICNGIAVASPVIRALLEHVEVLPDAKRIESKQTDWSGKQFVFTGVRLSDEDRKVFDACGCVEGSGVSKKTFALVQDSPHSSTLKTKKALGLGCVIMGYDEFVAQLRQL